MHDRKAIVLVAVFVAAVVLAGVAGTRTAPSEELYDPRRSTYLTGPEGARGFAQALEALGITVEERRRAWFGLAEDTAGVPPVIALLDVDIPLTGVERGELSRYVQEGGTLWLAGSNGVEQCFGASVDFRTDAFALAASDSLILPGVNAVLTESDVTEVGSEEAQRDGGIPCAVPLPRVVDTLMTTTDGDAVAWRIDYDGGGGVLMLADSRLLSNEVLKETDAGIVVFPWLIEDGGIRVLVDEYHQGFGEGGSIFLAAWHWTRASPSGWMLVQLGLAGLLALAVSAIRFGPAIQMIERRRRSALEHLDALAVGLERAEGHDAAAALIAGGLKRRLAAGRWVQRLEAREHRDWLGSMMLAARNDEARAAVRDLSRLLQEHRSSERVLSIATTVEDVWEALRPTAKSRES